MKNKLLLIFIIGVIFISSCTKNITKETDPGELVYVEKTVINLNVNDFRFDCGEIDTKNISYQLTFGDYVSRTNWKYDWLKTTINYPLSEFNLNTDNTKPSDTLCNFYGRFKVGIENINGTSYLEECRVEIDSCIMEDCSFEVTKQLSTCLDNID